MTPAIALIAAMGTALAQSPTSAPARARPLPRWNVLLLTLDTTRADAISCYGADPGLTPNLDRIARSGTRFATAYSAANSTNPSHVSLLTGLPAIRHGVHTNVQPIAPDLQTLPRVFRSAGYFTAAIPAIAHVGPELGWTDFDEMAGVPVELLAEDNTARAIGWLRARRFGNKPFFLWVHYFDPHVLYQPPRRIAEQFYRGDKTTGPSLLTDLPMLRAWDFPRLKRWLEGVRDPEYPRAMYRGEVHFVDQEIGKLFDYVRSQGLMNRTVIIVIADHGEGLGEHGIYYDHRGLYEHQVRIPFLVRIPGFPRNHVVREMVGHVDLVPTLAELFQLKVEDPGPGLSLARVLRGEPDPAVAGRDHLVIEAVSNTQVAVRRGGWKLIWPIMPQPALPREPELFDLESDPQELRNLAKERPETVASLRSLIEPWIQRGPAQLDTSNMTKERIEQLRSLGYIP